MLDLVDPAAEYPKQWYEQSAHTQERFESISHQMTPEDMVIQSASQLQNPREYEIDPALGGGQNHGLTYPQESQYRPENGRQSLPGESYGPNYGEGDSQMLEGRSDEQDDVDSLAGAGGPAKKASKSSAANELEMRQLFQSNKHRTLPEVATELHGNERGPQSERQRQVFAMLWYVFCSLVKGAELIRNAFIGSVKFATRGKGLYPEVEYMQIMYRDALRSESRYLIPPLLVNSCVYFSQD